MPISLSRLFSRVFVANAVFSVMKKNRLFVIFYIFSKTTRKRRGWGGLWLEYLYSHPIVSDLQLLFPFRWSLVTVQPRECRQQRILHRVVLPKWQSYRFRLASYRRSNAPKNKKNKKWQIIETRGRIDRTWTWRYRNMHAFIVVHDLSGWRSRQN